MASQDPPQDPRLDKPARYNRDDIVSDLQSFYAFLPHVHPSIVHFAPPGGWDVITPENLAKHNIHKTDEVATLLRHLPYISGPKPWIGPLALACDYRLVAEEPTAPSKPGWLFDASDKEWPEWVVQLTAGTDRDGSCWMLDTTDGTVTRYCVVGFEYPPSYAENDPRSWRDRCDPETMTLGDLLEEWRGSYHDTMLIGVPQPTDYPFVGAPDIYYSLPQDGPGSWRWEETEALRKIYREHGWPDDYKKEACIQALHNWWRDWYNRGPST